MVAEHRGRDGHDAVPHVGGARWTGRLSHAGIIFFFDRIPETSIERSSRHPRGNPAWPKVGIFAQRGKNRPNRLGVSVVRLLRVEGKRLHVAELDAIDGTPVVDIKPVIREFLPRGELRQPGWATELMYGYWRVAEAGET